MVLGTEISLGISLAKPPLGPTPLLHFIKWKCKRVGPKDASTLVARQYKYEVAKDSVRRAVMRLQYRFHTSSLSYTIN